MGPVITIVSKAYDLIKDPSRWTQGYYQRDIEGEKCEWKNGHSFCALGALFFVSSEDFENRLKAQAIIQRTSEKIFNGRWIQSVNDSHPSCIAHQNVMKIFESVIEKFNERDPTEDELMEGIPRLYQKICNS